MTSQEMRNALYQKKATDLLKRMVKLDSFRKATGGKIPSKRMTDCDFANRFVAFYLYRKEYDGNLDEFMGDALENINRMSQQEIDSIHDTFDRSMTICYRLLGNTALIMPKTANISYTKVSITGISNLIMYFTAIVTVNALVTADTAPPINCEFIFSLESLIS